MKAKRDPINMDMDTVKRVGKQISPGLYDVDGVLHCDPVEYCRTLGLLPTRENLLLVIRAVNHAVRKLNPRAIITDVYE